MAFSRDRVHVLLSIDSEQTDFTGAPAGWVKGGDYPQVWYQHYGKGRTSIPHSDVVMISGARMRRFASTFSAR